MTADGTTRETRRAALEAAAGFLACPACGEGLELAADALACANGHSFDVARQGYVNLLPGGGHTGTADTAAMLDARARVLEAGLFDPLSDALAEAVAVVVADVPGCVLEVGAGTGHHLARVLERAPGRAGVAADVSKHAARRAAAAHPRIASVVCDVWAGLPLRTGSAAALLDVFAPRNPAEFRRVLHPRGALVLATPTPRHLRELIGPLGMLSVDARKDERLEAALSEDFEMVSSSEVEWVMHLTREQALALAAMGPSAHHAPPDVDGAVEALPEPIGVIGSVTVTAMRPKDA